MTRDEWATGRVTRTVDSETQIALYGRQDWSETIGFLDLLTQANKAHVVALNYTGAMSEEVSRDVLRGILKLERERYSALANRSVPRGIYLAYERALLDIVADGRAGSLQAGRSRNDLSAALLRMDLRAPSLYLLSELFALVRSLLDRAKESPSPVMPLYTNYQPAAPSTFAHYLAACAVCIGKDTLAIARNVDECDVSPLGAASGAGSSVAVDATLLADLLGCRKTFDSSIDAVASWNDGLRLLGDLATVSVTLSRSSQDFLLWSVPDVGFVELPDELVGSSSVMPQKRNPYLLEVIQEKAARVSGCLTSSLVACHAKPLSNSIAVRETTSSELKRALLLVGEAALLFRKVVTHASTRASRMLDAAERGATSALFLAEWLVAEAGGEWTFRRAHEKVGELVTVAEASGDTLPAVFERWVRAELGILSLPSVEMRTIVESTGHGGPSVAGVEEAVHAATQYLAEASSIHDTMRDRWSLSASSLAIAVSDIVEGSARGR